MKKLLYLFSIIAILVACKPSTDSKQESFKMPAVSDVAMYQVNPRVFAPENSLNAVADRIDSIRNLGVNIMWVMPIYPIGIEKGKNSPYCISDYKAVAPEFGTIDDFKHLAQVCHEHGMGIILDWVANHTAWDHPWVKEHPDWYTHDEKADTIIHPRPWDWFDVADLNYDNQDMRAAMIDAMKFWITEVGIDGFRCDVADGVPADFWKDAIDQLRLAAKGRDILMLAEGKRSDNFTAGFDMNYGWDFKDSLVQVFCKEKPASMLFEADKKEYDSIPDGKRKMRFTTNHDHSTEVTPPVQFTNLRGSMAAYVATVFLHGCPLVYGSQEVGYPEPINFFKYVAVDWNANPALYQEYATLIKVINDQEVIRNGNIVPFPDDDILLFERNNDKERILVAVNGRNAEKKMTTPADWNGYKGMSLTNGMSLVLDKEIILKPFEYIILK